MIMLNIQIPCSECLPSDSQPNYCRKCGGSGYLRSTITRHQLARMRDIPQILGAYVIGKSPRPGRRRQKGRASR